MKPPPQQVLTRIKLLHTAIWIFLVACIVGVPLAAARREFLWAAILTGIVLAECLVLALNQGRCPLTDVAGRYTESRSDNFDIYLPRWLARYNKAIFGTLFAAGELYLIAEWLKTRG